MNKKTELDLLNFKRSGPTSNYNHQMGKKKNNKKKCSTNTNNAPATQNEETQNSNLNTSEQHSTSPPPTQEHESQNLHENRTDAEAATAMGMQNFYLELPPGNADSSSSEHWYSGHEENYAAEVRVRTLHGRIICEGAEPSSIREEEIYRILESNEVTDVEALYKTSKGTFILIFGSEDSASKCRSAELSATSGEGRVTLLFRERRRAPTFVTIFCPEYISCRAVELAFANFGEVQRVFYGTHTFNRNLRNGKRHVRIFPTGGDPRVLPRRITFLDGISRDVLYKEKIVDCYRCDTRHALGEGCPEVVGNQPNVAPHEQRSFSCNPTLTPSEHTATDGASTVVDEHRKAGVESAIESLSNQSEPEPDNSGSETLEEGEIRDDSAPTLQEIPKNPPLRNASQHPAKFLNPFGNIPEPSPVDYARSIYKSRNILKRIYKKKVIPLVIERFNITHYSKARFEFALNSAYGLAILQNITMFYKRLEMDKDKFNMQFNWDMSTEDYHAHLVNILEQTTHMWFEVQSKVDGMTE